MTLPAEDIAFLEAQGFRYEVTSERNFLCLVIFDYELPPGYSAAKADLLLRLPAGWPDAKPDMFWFSPRITYASGGKPPRSEANGSYVGRTWQRFSRHLQGRAWLPGDNLETWMTKIRDLLTTEAPK